MRSLFSQIMNGSSPDSPVTSQHDLRNMLASTLESRERWRSLLYQAVDLVFETDNRGRIIVISPETWLGQPTTALIGRPFSTLCGSVDILQPHTGSPLQITSPQGTPLTVILSSCPFHDSAGQITGTRGTLKAISSRVDTPVHPPAPAKVEATPLPENNGVAILAAVTTALRKAIVPRLASAAAMEALLAPLAAEGALQDTANPKSLLYSSSPLPSDIQNVLSTSTSQTGTSVFRAGTRHALICRENIRSLKQLYLVVWRAEPWSIVDQQLCQTVCSLLTGFWELDSIHRRILIDSDYDISSNLLNWNGLKAEIERRARRLDQETMPATLIVARVPGLTELSKTHGFEGGEDALRQCVALLRKAVRPTDAIGRISNNVFGLWMDGGDRFAAAERAERMTAHGIPILIDPPVHLPLQLGLVSREANAQETPETLLERGMQALQEGVAENRKWRFSHEAP
ncbi:diguanylate cyclase [Gluconobacter sp. Dm-62]|uniref:sensor domain-containing diguanylate cyclase n=1 Tax=Gluconobacter sp. Dm-62 TaxID=2799804 RepID=UPI001B8B40A8|nr:GGDEF domain-containing protein [Gluconobacter sp. Dm-62]MBS1102611.1 diguanylate cyclase [Gluconobacter sp. Dm-62]